MADDSSSSKVSLKLLIDSKTKKVLFAEANKEFVDFLFYILSLPVGIVIRLLSKNSMVGSLGNLYDSIENLSDHYKKFGQQRRHVSPLKVRRVAANTFSGDGSLQMRRRYCVVANTLFVAANIHIRR
uniref:DUF674 family protein n=1 Tax=Lactuca sativa TaxID=4236 RepID=A0A9R1XRS7_LACSA|nr:hypothetical protein LSAT_V11C200093170 [Lactuca sativa]